MNIRMLRGEDAVLSLTVEQASQCSFKMHLKRNASSIYVDDSATITVDGDTVTATVSGSGKYGAYEFDLRAKRDGGWTTVASGALAWI